MYVYVYIYMCVYICICMWGFFDEYIRVKSDISGWTPKLQTNMVVNLGKKVNLNLKKFEI